MTSLEIKKSLRIDIRSHHVKLSKFNVRARDAIVQYARGMSQWGMVRVARGKFRREIVRVFCAATNDRSEYRFHIYQLEDLLRHLSNFGILRDHIEFVEQPMYEPNLVELINKDEREPRSYQIPLIEYNVAPGKSKVTTLQTGKGKAQSLTSPIKVPGGWKTMGEMVLGDTVECPDGTLSKVVGVYPQGMREMFQVTFYDGRKTIVDANHLWKVYYVNAPEKDRWRIVDTREMMRLHAMPNPRVYIPLIQPCSVENEEEKKYLIDPYLLGALLGDGGMSVGVVTYTTADEFLKDEVQSLLPSEVEMKPTGKYGWLLSSPRGQSNSLLNNLREIGVYGTRSWEKVIPQEYLCGNRTQRLSLVQGLLDTDGYVDSNTGSVVYYTTSLELASQMQYLIRSLGGIATLGGKRTHFKHKGEKRAGRPCYCIYIRHQKPSELFRLPRKKDLTRDDSQYTEKLKLHVEKIESVGMMEAQCIAIDHPENLYITDQFIVTHNSFVATESFRKIGHRVLVVIKPMYIQKWVDDFAKVYDIGIEDVMVVQGSAHLKALLQLAVTGQLHSKIIIISNSTYRDYLKTYETFQLNMQPDYAVLPDDICEVMGVGVRFIDEVHQDFHFNFRCDLYTHVPKTLSLSATLESDDNVLNRIYAINWPMSIRAPEVEYDKYIVLSCLWYGVDPHMLPKLRHMGASKQYSHVEFEKSIMRQPVFLQKYLNMMASIVKTSYIGTRQPGQTMLIFCSTIKMCTLLMELLVKQYPDLMVRRYCEGDSYEEFLEADIAVSTLQSAGTAIDKPNLSKVLMSTALSGKQANEQAVGRLRRLKDFPETTPEFLFLSCRQIPKHVMYAHQKEAKLDGKVLSYKEYQTSFYL